VDITKFEKNYKKIKNTDYDTIIIIPSFNRFEKLDGLLTQLYEQNTKFKFKVIVYNDGSTDINYVNLPKKYTDIIYLSSEINNGKFNYWKTINILFDEVSKYTSYSVIQIDDDFILCDNFIDNLMAEYFKSKKIDNKYIAIHYHNNTLDKNGKKNWWGYDHGIDGGAIFDFNFLKEIDFKLEPIPKSRWDLNPLLSSGVWYQITELINVNSLLTYKLTHSLAYHNGNGDSKMNPIVRNKNPLKTPDFKNNDKLLNNEVSIIIPAWKADKWINDCLQSIYDQSWFKNKDNKWEILIGVDNCEDTKSAICPKGNTKIHYFTIHYGPYVIRNTLAYKVAKYKNLLFFDSDDLMHPDLIKDCFESNKELIRFQYLHHNNLKYTYGPSFVDKDILFKYGGYDNWICGADHDFISRLQKDRCVWFQLSGKNYIYRRVHNNQLTTRPDTGMGSKLRNSYFEKIKEKLKTNDLINTPVFGEFEEVVINNSKHTFSEEYIKLINQIKFISDDYIVCSCSTIKNIEKINLLKYRLDLLGCKYDIKCISDDIDIDNVFPKIILETLLKYHIPILYVDIDFLFLKQPIFEICSSDFDVGFMEGSDIRLFNTTKNSINYLNNWNNPTKIVNLKNIINI